MFVLSRPDVVWRSDVCYFLAGYCLGVRYWPDEARWSDTGEVLVTVN